VLPLFLSRHFVIGRRICVFLLLGALLGAFEGVGGARCGGGNERVDCKDEEEGVDGSMDVD
jgi:hypothetical protein